MQKFIVLKIRFQPAIIKVAGVEPNFKSTERIGEAHIEARRDIISSLFFFRKKL